METMRDLRRLMRRDASLDTGEATHLWGAVLDASLDEIEMGAMIGALAACGASDAELAGLHHAIRARLAPWKPALRGIVSIPAYGIVPGEAMWVALAATLLRRFGVPVVVHGVLDSPCGLSSARALRELGVLPCTSLAEADAHLHAGRIAFLPVQLLLPPFAALIALRARLGVENPAHVVAQSIDATGGAAIRMTFAIAGGAGDALERLDAVVDSGAIGLAWPAGRSPWHYELRPCIERLQDGRRERLFDADTQETRSGFVPLAEDAHAVAEWVTRIASGALPVPVPALNLVSACLYAVGQAETLTQAKAVAAIQGGRLAA